MKLVLGTLFTFLTLKTLACVCMPPKFTEKYTASDFVAKARIIKVYKNESDEELYKADILIHALYKGVSIKSIYVEGRSDGKRGSSCAIFIPENTELIIYAKNSDGNFTTGSCSGLVYLNQDKRTLRAEIREMEMLNILKKRSIKYTGNINYYPETGSFSKQTSTFNGIHLNKSFALYELIFAEDVTLKSVNVISGFNKKTDDELIEILKISTWKAMERNFIRKSVPDNSRFKIGFYYYSEEDKYQSFISENDL